MSRGEKKIIDSAHTHEHILWLQQEIHSIEEKCAELFSRSEKITFINS